MKKMLMLITALVMMTTNGFSEEMKAKEVKAETMGKKMPTRFQAVSADKVIILQEGEKKMYCPKCGMTLPMFYKTNHAAKINGKTEQYCSIHCLAVAMQDKAKITDLKVVDNTTLKFIDATKAWYVFGSNKPATMSMTSKYGFATKADAEVFAKNFGGKVMNFDDILASVKSTLTKESTMIAKKQSMMAKKGKLMYQKMCTPISTTFISVADAKTFLSKEKPCGDIKGKQLQAIALYLTSHMK